MIPRFAVLFLFLFSAAVCDLRERRIPNRLCFGGIIAGLLLQAVLYGVEGAACETQGLSMPGMRGILSGILFGLRGVLSGVAGILVPVALLFPLFAFGVLGAGDIKLFAVVGSFWGPVFVVRHIGCSFIAGAIWAVGILVKNRNLKERLTYFFGYLRAGKGRGRYYDAARDGCKNVMHFSVPMVFGFLAAVRGIV